MTTTESQTAEQQRIAMFARYATDHRVNRLDDTPFQVQGGARYTFRAIDEEIADYLGCPGANGVLVGQHGHMVGNISQIGRAEVRVTGWGSQRGILNLFTVFGGESLKGWLAVR